MDFSILAVSERIFGDAQRLTIPLQALSGTGAVGGQLDTGSSGAVGALGFSVLPPPQTIPKAETMPPLRTRVLWGFRQKRWVPEGSLLLASRVGEFVRSEVQDICAERSRFR